jgi:hypothetical protein
MSYPAATSIVYNEPTENTGIMRRLGKYGVTGTATLPAGSAGCTVSNVGMITASSMIFITDTNAGKNLIEGKYDSGMNLQRVTGDNGSFNVLTADTTFPTVDQTFMFMVINP